MNKERQADRLTQENWIMAISPVTEQELRNVRGSLKHLYPVPDDGDFRDLLRAIDRVARIRAER